MEGLEYSLINIGVVYNCLTGIDNLSWVSISAELLMSSSFPPPLTFCWSIPRELSANSMNCEFLKSVQFAYFDTLSSIVVGIIELLQFRTNNRSGWLVVWCYVLSTPDTQKCRSRHVQLPFMAHRGQKLQALITVLLPALSSRHSMKGGFVTSGHLLL